MQFVVDHKTMMLAETDAAMYDVDDRNNILKFRQVRKLDSILNETLVICGECGLPTISVTIKDFILAVKHKLELYHFPMVDMRLNGGGAAAVLDPRGTYKYNDIDIVIILDSSQIEDDDIYFNDTIKAVLDVIADLLQPMSPNTAKLFTTQKLSYIQKLVKIRNCENGDSWSLLGLGDSGQFQCRSRRIDLKFTHRMKRQYEFSIDSFQIVLDSLLLFYEALCKFSSPHVYINENFYPTVCVSSKWSSLADAIYHLGKRYIITSQPEHIRGGGLLKYCKLLVQNFTVPDRNASPLLETYMCSRFFIDYHDLKSQHKAIVSYLKNHFQLDQAHGFLATLKRVISASSGCLMNQERQQTLGLIDRISMDIDYPFIVCQPQLQHCFSDVEWSVDKVIDGITLSHFRGPSAPSRRSYSTVSSEWSTPTDMSPIDQSDSHHLHTL